MQGTGKVYVLLNIQKKQKKNTRRNKDDLLLEVKLFQ